MSEDQQEKPRLVVVRDTDTPALPPLPAPVPDSVHRRALRARIAIARDTVADATRLCAVGIVLADGAAELRPGMSARAAKVWIDRHAEDLDRARYEILGGHGAPGYAQMDDLREAVLGAAAELDEAAVAASAPNLAAAVYAVVDRVENGRPAETGAAQEVEVKSLAERVRELYDFGLVVLEQGY